MASCHEFDESARSDSPSLVVNNVEEASYDTVKLISDDDERHGVVNVLANSVDSLRDVPNVSIRNEDEENESILVRPLYAYTLVLMSVIGTGLLSLPSAFRCLGVGSGLAALAMTGTAMYFSGNIVLRSHLVCENPKPISFDELTVRSCEAVSFRDQWIRNIVNITNALGLFGGCCAYVAVGSDIYPSLRERFLTDELQDKWYLSRQMADFVMVFCVSLPLCLLRDLGRLRYVTMVGFMFSLYMVSLVAFRGFYAIFDGSTKLKGFWGRECLDSSWWSAFLAGFSVFCFSFVFHFNILPVYNIMRPTGKHSKPVIMRNVLAGVVLTGSISYSLLGIGGVSLFGNDTKDNILDNFSSSDDAVNLARVAICLCCYLCLPLLMHPLRSSMHALMGIRNSRRNDAISSVVLLSLQYIVSTLVPSIRYILQFTGGTSAVGSCFLFPLGFGLSMLIPRRSRLVDEVSDLCLRLLRNEEAARVYFLTRFEILFACLILVAFPVFGIWSTIDSL